MNDVPQEILDKRETHRVVVSPDFTIRFKTHGAAFQSVPLANISAGGCFATVSFRSGLQIEKGDLLEELVFEHRALPKAVLTGRVVFSLQNEDPDGQLDFTGIGVAFVSISPEAKAGIERFVAQRMKIG